ncbi:MAG: hypothetical protein CMG00_08660 [Candidatus Marinimicrobia bacterium]|nr:hypothetical protein [Candidatus Neomarinimicrobiota bacterium]
MINIFLLKILSISIVFSFNNNFSLVDSLYDNRLTHEAFLQINSLYKKYPNDIDVLFRLARSHLDKAEQELDLEIQKSYYYKGFEYAKKAISVDPQSGYANFWYAALIGKIGELEGGQQRIVNSYEVKKYGMKAVELEPAFDGCHHLMGRWHFELANLSWVERSMARIIYGVPPQGSLDSAILFFKEAIRIDSNQIRHHYWLARTYYAMGNYKLAEDEFKIVLSLDALDNNDKILQEDSKRYF